MITFVSDDTSIDCPDTYTILEAKQYIINQLGLPCKYIDLDFILEKPSRVLGKFNVEPGKLPRTLDRYTLERFAFKPTMNISYSIIDDYDPSKPRTPLQSRSGISTNSISGVYKPPVSSFNHTSNEQDMNIEPQFNIDSQVDFPSLA